MRITLCCLLLYTLLSSDSCKDKKVKFLVDRSVDRAPVVQINSWDQNGNDIISNQSSTTVNVPLGKILTFTGWAKNEVGGVQSFTLQVNPQGNTATVSSAPDAQSNVPTILRITGVNGLGGNTITGSFNSEGQTLTVTGKSFNFNGMSSEINVVYKAAFLPPKIEYLKFAPRDPPIGHGEEDGYIPIGQSTTVKWKLSHCGGGCDISLTAMDNGPSYNHTLLDLKNLSPEGSSPVTPREEWTLYTLTVTSPWGMDKKTYTEQLYVPH